GPHDRRINVLRRGVVPIVGKRGARRWTSDSRARGADGSAAIAGEGFHLATIRLPDQGSTLVAKFLALIRHVAGISGASLIRRRPVQSNEFLPGKRRGLLDGGFRRPAA